MQGVVSFLDPLHIDQVQEIWRALVDICGLKEGLPDGPPHLSWHIAQEYDLARLRPQLEALAAELPPISVRTAGLGLFTGECPILYISLVRDARLAGVHQQIYDCVSRFALQPSLYYAPDNWVPHISLVVRNCDTGQLGCALDVLALRSLSWQVSLDHLALVGEGDESAPSIEYQYPLGG